MEPYDKNGNQLYPRTFNILLEQARLLRKAGYAETRWKPNRFYRKNVKAKITFFADMRGTDKWRSDYIPVWVNPIPYFYPLFKAEHSERERYLIIQNEMKRLAQIGCECRLASNYKYTEEYVCEQCEKKFFSDETSFYNGELLCLICKKAQKDLDKKKQEALERETQEKQEALERETQEEKIRLGNRWVTCMGCKKLMRYRQGISHHVTYIPEKRVSVCRSCHGKLQWLDKYPHLKHLKPERSRKEWIRERQEIRQKKREEKRQEKEEKKLEKEKREQVIRESQRVIQEKAKRWQREQKEKEEAERERAERWEWQKGLLYEFSEEQLNKWHIVIDKDILGHAERKEQEKKESKEYVFGEVYSKRFRKQHYLD